MRGRQGACLPAPRAAAPALMLLPALSHFSLLSTSVEDLLLWRDVPKTGAVVGGITALYLLLEW